MRVLRSLIEADHVGGASGHFAERVMLIGDVADRVDLEPETIRFYEKMGLLKPRRLGQLRVFVDDDIEVLLLIRTLRQYGMPISQVREALTLHQQQDETSDTRIKILLTAQLEVLNVRHRELTEQIAALDSTLSQHLGVATG